jgi:hypothetical protein
VAAIAIGITVFNMSSEPTGPLPIHLPPASESYLGVYTKGLPDSYRPITAFAVISHGLGETCRKRDIPSAVVHYYVRLGPCGIGECCDRSIRVGESLGIHTQV